MAPRLLSALVAAPTLASAILLSRNTNKADGNSEDGPFRQSMTNSGDAQYTGIMKVGGQELNAVFDTGSFELLVLSSNCSMCGTKSGLFHEDHSNSYEGSQFKAEHSFGSGTTNSIEAHDKCSIGHLQTEKQVFWEVYDANMPILLEDSFQAILGIGPPTSAVKFAQEDVDEVHTELKEYQSGGNDVSEKVQLTVQHYEDILTHAEAAASVVQNLNVQDMSVCLGKESLSDGYMIWNDNAKENYPERFTTVDVVGDYYWSADLTSVKLGTADQIDESLGETKLGCYHEQCSAVIDSGTTLIVAPQNVIDDVNSAMDKWIEAGGTCDDVSKLPELHFQLGGKDFTLPPESYIGKVSGEMNAMVKKYMPHVYETKKNKMSRWGDCETLLMAMDMDSQLGTTWILGMPFFRKYYSMFHFDKNKGDFAAKAMSFSVADSNCEPGSASGEGGALIASQDRSARMRNKLDVDTSKIRMGKLADRVASAKAKSGKLSVGNPFVRI